jgi:hypothetical protein
MHLKLIVCMALCAIVPACTTLATAQDTNSAKEFLVSVYHLYAKGGKGADWTGPKAGQYYHSSLLALIREDAKAAGPDNVPVLDADPVCSCQDLDGIFDLKIEVQPQAPDRAVAAVSFAVFKGGTKNDRRVLSITLASEKGAWRIYDILDNSDPKAPFALRAELKKDIAVYAKESKAKPAK